MTAAGMVRARLEPQRAQRGGTVVSAEQEAAALLVTGAAMALTHGAAAVLAGQEIVLAPLVSRLG